MSRTMAVSLAAGVLVLLASACGTADRTTGSNALPLTVSFSSKVVPSGGSPGANTMGSFTQVTGNDTLIITRVELVLSKIELSLTETASCEEESASDPDCDELHADPELVDLPLGTNTMTLLLASVPPGTYRRFEGKIHFVAGGGSSAAAAFLQAHPDLAGVSVKVQGTFDGTPFTYTSGAEANLELEFSPPLVVDQSGMNITVHVDLGRWFVDRSGMLIDPATADPGGPNDNLVDQNIHRSFQAFEDADKDGEEDAHS